MRVPGTLPTRPRVAAGGDDGCAPRARERSWRSPTTTGRSVMKVVVAGIHVLDFFPGLVVLVGIPVGLLVRRWWLLVIPLVLWFDTGVVFGVVPAIVRGRGDP